MSDPVIISTFVNTTPQEAWRFWTGPEHICGWNFASPEWCCPSAESDLRVGGRYSARMEARDGSMGFDFGGVFDVVEPHALLESTLGDGRRVKVRFAAEAGGTRVTEVFDPESENPVELQRMGWQSILDNYGAYVAAQT